MSKRAMELKITRKKQLAENEKVRTIKKANYACFQENGQVKDGREWCGAHLEGLAVRIWFLSFSFLSLLLPSLCGLLEERGAWRIKQDKNLNA